MIAGAAENDHGVNALVHGFADFGEVQVEGMGVGARQHRAAQALHAGQAAPKM